MIGKTIARIEEAPTSVEYGYEDHGTVLIHFTDGTGLEISGSSHEEVSQYVQSVDRQAILRRAHAAQGRREAARQAKLNRAGWMALTCEERGRRNGEKYAKANPFVRMTEEVFSDLIEDQMRSSLFFGHYGDGKRTIRKRCKTCAERECPNAPIEEIGSHKRGLVYQAGTMTIPIRSEPDGDD